MLSVQLVLDVRAELGEGPLWDHDRRRLLFVDIHRSQIHVFDPATGIDRVIDAGRQVSALGLSRSGGWIAAADGGFVRIDPATGVVTPVVQVEPSASRRRMNDGAVDPAGRFWAGSMSLDGVAGQGTLYRLDDDRTVTPMLTPVTTSNGPAWSPDGRLMYFVDTRTRRIDVFDFGVSSGTIANRRTFAAFPDGPGRPDGVIVDRDGGVWVALWQGAAIHRYRADGALDLVVPMPTVCPTKCSFGGDTLSDLYVTTAMAPLDQAGRARDRLAGGLFCIRTDFVGIPASLYSSGDL